MEGCGHRQRHRAPDAVRLADLGHAVERQLVAGQHDLRRLVVVGDLADVALRGASATLRAGVDADAEQRRHGTLADGNGRLHGLAAQFQQPRRVGEREGAGRGKRRIFAQRMAGDELDLILELKPCSLSSTRITAIDTAISAGCAFSVSVRVSFGPSHMISDRFWPSAASTSSNTSRAAA